MRVITLQEPWASLIGAKIKTIETRSWPCYVYGDLYIHAAKSTIKKEEQRRLELQGLVPAPLHYGEIFIKTTLSDCVLITEEYARQIKERDPLCFYCGDFTPGRYAWVLSNIELIAPIKARGKLGIWYHSSNESCSH